MKKEFKQYLINQNLSANTINSYLFTLNQLHKMYDKLFAIDLCEL